MSDAARPEAGALAAAAVAWVVLLITRGSAVVGAALFLIVFALGLGAALATAARALRRGSRPARGPIITWQLLQAATAIAVVAVPGRPGWVAAAALAVVVLSCTVAGALLTPRAVAFATR